MDVCADINYFPAAEEEIEKVITTEDWKPRFLGVRGEGTRTMTIHDMRGIEDHFDLDTNGFQFIRLADNNDDDDKLGNFESDEILQNKYFPELEEIFKTILSAPRTGASQVHIFNHVIRRSSNPFAKGQLDPSTGQWQIPPSGHPHVDYSGRPEDLRGTLEELQLPAHIEALFGSAPRFAFVNAWRPLRTIARDPLAVADAATVPDADYLLRERKFRPSGVRSGNYVLSHTRAGAGDGGKDGEERHMWYWMSEMRPNEMVVFKGLDTARDKPGWRCPHTAFILPGTEDLPARESIEVRAVCFWE
ncbi:hypothetical protein M406DRAFT_67915 [Cryphonectria parasitica EP155]|uniref:Uncharacterized protein n=1 Tax=Cryphonectria parasitica (strain ATCC 38755 / EP155) TaxID=660469 RepID=A0A9P4Y1X8_CRYP1|nr:uncharacterized protein M406DRAFT_67915 [Cryphonectria parasitica EP155]KAF3765472.1 hypothetical protein M406DRAFT_67915 [Cryphonectria parasitica EP155]